jgi:hypothetical protein
MSQDNDRIPFEEEETLSVTEENSGRSISHNASLSGDIPEGHKFSRPMRKTGVGATRCHIFRSKISVPAIESLEEHINEWLDSDDIDVKEIGHLVGKMHGKTDEDCIIVMAWY